MEQQIKVAVAESRDLVRQGLLSELGGESVIDVAGEALSARQAGELADTTHPNVIVTGASLPEKDPAGPILKITAQNENKILIFTRSLLPEQLFDFFKTEASGFIPEDSPAGNVVSECKNRVKNPAYTVQFFGQGAQGRSP